jgi:hypothetical protein
VQLKRLAARVCAGAGTAGGVGVESAHGLEGSRANSPPSALRRRKA